MILRVHYDIISRVPERPSVYSWSNLLTTTCSIFGQFLLWLVMNIRMKTLSELFKNRTCSPAASKGVSWMLSIRRLDGVLGDGGLLKGCSWLPEARGSSHLSSATVRYWVLTTMMWTCWLPLRAFRSLTSSQGLDCSLTPVPQCQAVLVTEFLHWMSFCLNFYYICLFIFVCVCVFRHSYATVCMSWLGGKPFYCLVISLLPFPFSISEINSVIIWSYLFWILYDLISHVLLRSLCLLTRDFGLQWVLA